MQQPPRLSSERLNTTTDHTHTMNSLLRTLALPARLLGARQTVGVLAGKTTAWTPSLFGATAGWLAPAARTVVGGGLMQQTRGMKVHSSVKKRCEHCKVRRAPLRPCVSDARSSAVWGDSGVGDRRSVLTRTGGIAGCSTKGRQAT